MVSTFLQLPSWVGCNLEPPLATVIVYTGTSLVPRCTRRPNRSSKSARIIGPRIIATLTGSAVVAVILYFAEFNQPGPPSIGIIGKVGFSVFTRPSANTS